MWVIFVNHGQISSDTSKDAKEKQFCQPSVKQAGLRLKSRSSLNDDFQLAKPDHRYITNHKAQ